MIGALGDEQGAGATGFAPCRRPFPPVAADRRKDIGPTDLQQKGVGEGGERTGCKNTIQRCGRRKGKDRSAGAARKLTKGGCHARAACCQRTERTQRMTSHGECGPLPCQPVRPDPPVARTSPPYGRQPAASVIVMRKDQAVDSRMRQSLPEPIIGGGRLSHARREKQCYERIDGAMELRARRRRRSHASAHGRSAGRMVRTCAIRPCWSIVR